MNLKHLTDKQLLNDLKMLVSSERVFLTQILHHLREVEDRKLFSELGYSSLFEYTQKELGYSEPAAGRRIQAARLIKRLPEAEKKIESGTLSLTNAAKANTLFQRHDIDPKKQKEIIKSIENTSTRDCEKRLLGYADPAPLPKNSIRVVTSEHTLIKVSVTEDTLSLLIEARSYLAQPHLNDEALKKIAKHAIANIKRVKFKQVEHPRHEKNSTNRTPTNSQKRITFKNGQGVCENCGGIFNLQFDHCTPFAWGGQTTLSNLRLLCFNCNQRARIRARL